MVSKCLFAAALVYAVLILYMGVASAIQIFARSEKVR